MYYLYAFVAVILYALLPVIAKKVAIDGLPPMMFIVLTMFILALGALVGSLIFEKVQFSSITYSQWLGIIAFGIINLIAFLLFIIAIKEMPIAHYQIMGLLMPVIGGTIAYFMFGEKLSPHFFIGFLLMSVGLIIALGTFTTN